MKIDSKCLFIFVSILLLISCGRKKIVVNHSKSNVPYQIYYKNKLTGNIEGEKRTFFESGKLFMIENYSNAMPEGEFRLFCENGQLNEWGNYENGQLEGVLNFESCNNKLKYGLEYKLGLVWNVEFITFEEMPLVRGSLENGDGSLLKYNVNGIKERVYNFKSGKKNGWQYLITSTGYVDSTFVKSNIEVDSGHNVDFY